MPDALPAKRVPVVKVAATVLLPADVDVARFAVTEVFTESAKV